MLRKILFALGCSGFAFASSASDAYAVFVLEQASFEMQDPDDGPPLVGIRRVDASGGQVFTNQFTSPNGPFGAGGEVRTISAARLSVAIDGENFQPLQDSRVGFEGNDLIAISAIRGTITASGPGVATATFTDGRIYVVSVAGSGSAVPPAMGFDGRDPDTWNFAAGAFVEMRLKAPEDVLPGDGQQLTFDASVINQSSVNTTAGNQAQGRFLFEEDSTVAQNAVPSSGDDWMTVTTNALPLSTILGEGLLSQASQTIEFADINAVGVVPDSAVLSGPALAASDLAVFNAIYADMSVKAGLGPLVFATGFGPGPDSNWNPQFAPPGSDVVTGDFRGELQLANSPGIQGIVPEPGSMTLLAAGLASLGAFAGVRRRPRRREACDA